MKRDPALIPLSRDHHQMLLLAQLLKQGAPPYKGLPTTAEGKAKYLEDAWEGVVLPHMEEEESQLFPLARRLENEEVTGMVDRLEKEHRQLGALYDGVMQNPDRIAAQDALGRLLERHIRFEEREFFQLVQRKMPSEMLQVLLKK